jgi:hypothetical protein
MRRSLPVCLTAVLLLLICAVPSARAQDEAANKPVEIDASDKAALTAAIGKPVVVRGTIKKADWSKSGKVMNVEFEGSELIGAVFEQNKESINAATDGDAAKKWTGAKVKLTGKLERYGGRAKALEGRPQIVITKAEQVTVEKKD